VALNECHVRSSGVVVHRDLKPGNILLKLHSDSCIREVKLGDFGLAKNNGGEASTHGLGTRLYRAPEQFQRPQSARIQGNGAEKIKYGRKVDIWSFGMLALRLLLRGEDKNTRNQTMEIAGLGRACCREVKYKKEEKALGTLAERCLAKKPEDRPDAIRVIQELKKQVDGRRIQDLGCSLHIFTI